jgi:hypothetical protein
MRSKALKPNAEVGQRKRVVRARPQREVALRGSRGSPCRDEPPLITQVNGFTLTRTRAEIHLTNCLRESLCASGQALTGKPEYPWRGRPGSEIEQRAGVRAEHVAPAEVSAEHRH